jgi:predicted nucleotide-binding protein
MVFVAGSSPVVAPTVFASYARVDAVIVREFAGALERAGIRVLLDVEFLQPGQQWDQVILDHVRSADALVFFVSQASLKSRWVETELVAFGRASGRTIIPILIEGIDFSDLPPSLAQYQGVRVRDASEVPTAALQIAEALRSDHVKPTVNPTEAEYRAARLSSDLAEDLRHPEAASPPSTPGNAVFLVHGHDLEFRDEVDTVLRSLGVESVVLSKTGGASRSLFQKFETLAHQARFAVVLLSADDVGASRRQFEADERGGDKTLKFRARENVILELGFFYGRLGWEGVFVVQKPPEHVWPDFERPSDLAGVVFLEARGESDWRAELTESLAKAGLILT